MWGLGLLDMLGLLRLLSRREMLISHSKTVPFALVFLSATDRERKATFTVRRVMQRVPTDLDEGAQYSPVSHVYCLLLLPPPPPVQLLIAAVRNVRTKLLGKIMARSQDARF